MGKGGSWGEGGGICGALSGSALSDEGRSEQTLKRDIDGCEGNK
jgi:hypothetical protein